jgi:hypothetical protein
MHNPQEEFHSWLAGSLARALRAFASPERDLECLAHAVDHADLEWRVRLIERGMPSPMFR